MTLRFSPSGDYVAVSASPFSGGNVSGGPSYARTGYGGYHAAYLPTQDQDQVDISGKEVGDLVKSLYYHSKSGQHSENKLHF